MIKYKLSEVAKDLNLSNKDVADVLKERMNVIKKPTTTLTDDELKIVFEHFTQKTSVESFDEYFNSAVHEQEPAAEPVKEQPAPAEESKAAQTKQESSAAAKPEGKKQEKPVSKQVKEEKPAQKGKKPEKAAAQQKPGQKQKQGGNAPQSTGAQDEGYGSRNRVINTRGFAISPTVKEGYILKTSEDLLDIMQITTGRLPYVFPLTTQDITPYGNDLYHLNSVLQPCTATPAPVVGVAITTEMPVPGCATGATHICDVEEAARFMLEVAKSFGRGECQFYDKEEYEKIVHKYGSMKHLQTKGRE